MANHWHLTPQSGEIKGNNPYQLNRMTVDPSFRATSGYNLSDIQGYSATGEVVLKGQPLSLAPLKESPSPPKTPTSAQKCVEHFGASGKRARKMRRKARMAKLEEVIQATDWQREFSSGMPQSHLGHLNQLTESRYNEIMKPRY